ncbi:MAG: methionine synthase [Spirochaetales bacterium]|nr:methionine synthase [Spirochaetales bacterium]
MNDSDLQVLRDIPFSFDRAAFDRHVQLERFPSAREAVEALLGEALGRARPKAMYRESYVRNREGRSLELEGVRFDSRVLSENLAAVERVFPYVATCGSELDELPGVAEDLLASFWLDVFKEMVLDAAVKHLVGLLRRRYGLPGLSSMNPGSGDRNVWPIAQQKPLFALFDGAEQEIGVRLTDSFLMTPNKTVSGLFFPTDVPFESCQLCTRADCPRRRAPYRGPLEGIHP